MNEKNLPNLKDRKGERGAALVMALLITFLLLVASTGLILESSMNSANVTDATAEQQAYNAAESGIQAAVNVLRGNAAPSPLFDTASPATPASIQANKITYVKALNVSTSNVTGDLASTSGRKRLSRWITYTGTDADDPSKLGQPNVGYNTATGYAFDLEITDPDNTGTNVSYETKGFLHDSDVDNPSRRTYGSMAGNGLRITYVPTTVTDHPGVGHTNFGTFKVEFGASGGAAIPALNRFEITIKMTAPGGGGTFFPSRVMRGYILMNSSPYNTPPVIVFDSQTYELHGAQIMLNFEMPSYVWPNQPSLTCSTGADQLPAMTSASRTCGTSQPFGYQARLNTGDNVLDGTFSSAEPTKLRIVSTGYGPRGAVKRLEAIIQKNFFNDMTAPATITMVGPNTSSNPSTSFLFDPGTSNATMYSGADANPNGTGTLYPPIGVTQPPDSSGTDPNLEDVFDATGGHFANNIVGVPSNVSNEVPEWLSSPQALDATVKSLYEKALNSKDATNLTGRVFTNTGTGSIDIVDFGDPVKADTITFCDGNCTIGPGDGGGILVVTGQLELKGNFTFRGLIIVTGQDGVLRSGGGTGTISGNIVVAPYRNSTVYGGTNPPLNQDFLAPRYQTQGSGNSEIVFNSDSLANGLTAVSNVVLGVVEK